MHNYDLKIKPGNRLHDYHVADPNLRYIYMRTKIKLNFIINETLHFRDYIDYLLYKLYNYSINIFYIRRSKCLKDTIKQLYSW
jgi:hypothetical protein